MDCVLFSQVGYVCVLDFLVIIHLQKSNKLFLIRCARSEFPGIPAYHVSPVSECSQGDAGHQSKLSRQSQVGCSLFYSTFLVIFVLSQTDCLPHPKSQNILLFLRGGRGLMSPVIIFDILHFRALVQTVVKDELRQEIKKNQQVCLWIVMNKDKTKCFTLL